MLASPRQKILTPQHYLEWEESQELRYEYVNGEVFGMTGRTILHNDIAVNLSTAKKNICVVRIVKFSWQMPKSGFRARTFSLSRCHGFLRRTRSAITQIYPTSLSNC